MTTRNDHRRILTQATLTASTQSGGFLTADRTPRARAGLGVRREFGFAARPASVLPLAVVCALFGCASKQVPTSPSPVASPADALLAPQPSPPPPSAERSDNGGKVAPAGNASSAGGAAAQPTPEEALQRLLDGNRAYVANASRQHPMGHERRTDILKDQRPFAIVVGCSDSRVPPELLFNQGLGDLWVIRTGGEVVKDVEIGTIEYAVSKLGTPLIVILGHNDCCAINTTIRGGNPPGRIGSVVAQVKPAVDEARTLPGDLTDNAIRVNTRIVAETIRTSAIVREMEERKKLQIVRAYYDLESGLVSTYGQSH